MQKYQRSRKLQFAMDWLVDHPSHMFATGRVLESRVKMSEWQKISYKTWNEAKRLLSIPTFNDITEPEPRRVVIVNFNEHTVTYQGRKGRTVRQRSDESMRRTVDLCKLQGYRVIIPIGGVFILTKEFEDMEGKAA